MKKFLLSLVFLVAGCATGPIPPGHDDNLVLESHPLVGRILDVDSESWLTRDALIDAVEKADYLLLGEIHDNAVHHRIQEEIVRHLATLDRSVSISFEMIDLTQGKDIASGDLDSAEALIDYLSSTQSGWGYRRHYAGVIEAAFDAGFPILPANLERSKLMEMARGEVEINPMVRELLDRVALTEHDLEHITDEIAEAHCGYLVESMVPPMVAAQRFRDAIMASSLLESDAQTRVLIAGTGHTRDDRGVPRFVRERNPDAIIISLGLVEVVQEAENLDTYLAMWDHAELPFDYVWFTPRAARSDPCEEMRTHMEERDSTD
ncbi:MAG: ChaN family lipoprotein [Pseudomonadales bacterium]|nr:ChaN family lipoprotein [Pseudomonadales bacterium]